MNFKWTALVVALWCSACANGVEQKGTQTVAMRGAKFLTTKGDELMQTGVYSQREVTPQFAAGYTKGKSDAAKEDFFGHRDQMAQPSSDPNAGTVNEYPMVIPEGYDDHHVLRAPQKVVVPMVEFIRGKKL